MLLAGKIAFVTGASRGIGAAIAKGLAAAGADVALSYQSNADMAQAVCADIAAQGRKAIAVQADVRDRAAMRAAYDQAERDLGGIDILVNNAGINNPTDFDQITDEDWDEILGVNLKGPFICAQEVLAFLKKRGGGSIVNIGSVSGQYGGPRTAHYAASKAGLISLGQVIARFGAPDNIRCNTVAAGLIESEMAAAGMQSAAVQEAAKNVVMKRFGTPDEVADAVVYLASDKSSYITAQTINVNGGLYF
ncbi:3-oxoacyl-ACP reductase family protein [Magnetovibrio sp.]|uniref:SDR family NAD(P)-dependent oxidoreductase n=1 Tax=Magnetovibrio sp. TaxID=2024836 RepID=UPI002F9397A0